jgi:hypothetical protein
MIIDNSSSTGYQRLVPGIPLLLEPTHRRRCIGVVLFVAVFFLPLHFHAGATNSQIKQECGCFAGAKTQASVALAAVDFTPSFEEFFIAICQPRDCGRPFPRSESIRAPPFFYSFS